MVVMKKIARVVSTLLILCSVFGVTESFAESVGKSLQGKAFVETTPLTNATGRVRCSASSGQTSKYNVDFYIGWGNQISEIQTRDFMVTLKKGQVFSRDKSSNKNFVRGALYGYDKAAPLPGCIGSVLLTQL